MVKKTLKVAMIAPPWLALPTKGYGGIELVIEGLIDSLRKEGIEVELIGNGARSMKGIKTRALYKKDLFDKIDWPYYDAPLQVMQAHLHFALITSRSRVTSISSMTTTRILGLRFFLSRHVQRLYRRFSIRFMVHLSRQPLKSQVAKRTIGRNWR